MSLAAERREAYREALGRIDSQRDRVLATMTPGRWFTKEVLAEVVGGSPHAMSARLSELRALGHQIERRHQGRGLYLYRIAPRTTAGA